MTVLDTSTVFNFLSPKYAVNVPVLIAPNEDSIWYSTSTVWFGALYIVSTKILVSIGSICNVVFRIVSKKLLLLSIYSMVKVCLPIFNWLMLIL